MYFRNRLTRFSTARRFDAVALNPQPLPPGGLVSLNPQPLPPRFVQGGIMIVGG